MAINLSKYQLEGRPADYGGGGRQQKAAQNSLAGRLDKRFSNLGPDASRRDQIDVLKRKRKKAQDAGNQRRAKKLKEELKFFRNQYSPNFKQPLIKVPQQVPQVQISPDGTLQLPFNENFSSQMYDAMGQSQQSLLELKQQQDMQGQQYGDQRRELRKGFEEDKKETLNRNAARGTAFSSAYGTQLSDVAQDFTQGMGQLEQENTQFRQQADMQRAAIQALLNRQLGDASFALSGDLAGEAGQLGYGVSQADRLNQAQRRLQQLQKRRKKVKKAGNTRRAKRIGGRIQNLKSQFGEL